MCGGVRDISGQPVFKGIAAECTPGPGREQRVRGPTGAFGEPGAQEGDGARGQRRDPLFSPLAGATEMRTGPEMDIGRGKPDQFGGAQAGLDGESEERSVASPGPGRPVRRGQQRLDLHFGQVCDQPSFEAFRRDGENTFDGGGMFGMAQGGIAEQGPDRCQSGIAGAHTVLPVRLEMVEEGADHGRVEIVDIQPARCLAEPLRCEGQQEPQSITIGLDRVRADLALAEETVGEERLQGWGKRAHASPAR